ncbi:hypothetical protein N7379_26395 [Rhizobium pusense]|uniref:hypothetical protein n=1 Tax=Agrobacterium pusense TaxID=648995 RepID=UPI002449209D|nr:hypothetical protein [Agrobacterium pusense]MDH0118001.1 hypothetical protein [Agrobacterium pusense]
MGDVLHYTDGAHDLLGVFAEAGHRLRLREDGSSTLVTRSRGRSLFGRSAMAASTLAALFDINAHPRSADKTGEETKTPMISVLLMVQPQSFWTFSFF